MLEEVGVRREGAAVPAEERWYCVAAERVLALVLLVASLPIVAVLALYVRITDGRPCFYRGVRLGRGKRAFVMYKLRTLRVGAQSVTGAELLNHRHDLNIRGGRFLRDTRLDELPQLWNIVRGDMLFVGPRPERPEVFAAKCADIPGYELRFAVRPGLIGISQLFTPHGTSKRYRTLIDNGGLRRAEGFVHRLGILAYAMLVILREVVRRAVRQLFFLRARLTGRYREKRRLRRVTPPGAVVHFGRRTAHIVDMNEETVLVECEQEIALEDETELLLDIPVRGISAPGRRVARCKGDYVAVRRSPTSTRILMRYEALSPCSEYMIHQYFLRSSLAPPRRALAEPAWTGGGNGRSPRDTIAGRSRFEPRIVRNGAAQGRSGASPNGHQSTVINTVCVPVEPSSSVTARVTRYEPGTGKTRDKLA